MKKATLKNYDILDLTKIILSFMVVAIHANIYPEYLYPWLYLPIPLFFVISSFLLFKKINNSKPSKRNDIIKKYIIRLLKLYLFWFIVLLPLTIINRASWFDNGLLMGILKTIKSVLFSSTFKGSWYLVATIEGTIIVNYFANKKIENVIIFLSIFSYILCCLSSAYCYSLSDNAQVILKWLEPQFTFLFSLVFIYIGKLFAEDRFKDIKKPIYLIASIIFGLLLYKEWDLIYHVTKVYNPGYFFYVLPMTFSLFGIIINTNIKLKNGKILRELSSFMYPLHISLMPLIIAIVEKHVHGNDLIAIVAYLITIIICTITFFLIKKLEKYKYFSILKNSY